ncbi:MAG: cation transporter [Chitinophagaceae bacterium]|nr:cation transporter [Chitinophagaceae bacterium]
MATTPTKEHTQHHHHHGEPVELTQVNKAFIIGISLNLLFVLVEVIAGLKIHSLSLLSDAGHNLADVGALALSLLAYRLLKVKPNEKYTYGYRKTSILTALFNAVILLVTTGAIVYEAIHRLLNPESLPGNMIALIAGVGILINAFTAILFLKDKNKDINIKSAYLHLMSDALVSAGLVAGGILIHYTNWYWLDPAFSIVIAVIIVSGTWSLLKDSLRLSLDGVPPDVDIQKVKETALKVKGILDMHHLHIWAISTTQNALTAHVVVDETSTMPEIEEMKKRLKHELEHQKISHVTLETEIKSNDCQEPDC